jgi:hypothetical protein
MSSTSTNKQQQQPQPSDAANTAATSSLTSELAEPLEKIDSNFLIHLRKMNDQLDHEESFNKINRPVRHLLYKQDILNNQLIQIYKITSNNLVQFDLNDLSKLFEPQPHNSKLNTNNDYRKCFKLFQTHIELCKLTVDLTTPIELLLINRHFIYNTLSKLDLYDHHEQPHASNPQMDTSEQHSTTSADSTSKMKNIQAINAKLSLIIEANLEKFKDIFFKLNYFDELGSSLAKLIQIYQHLAELIASDKNQQQTQPSEPEMYTKSNSNSLSTNSATSSSRFKKLRQLKSLILDDIILNLCLVRNLAFERNEIKLNHFICNLMKYKLDKSLITLCSLNEPDLNVSERMYKKHSFVILSLGCQIMSLLFSQLNTFNTKIVSTKSSDVKQAGVVMKIFLSLKFF